MEDPHFIFAPGDWTGEGKIWLSMVGEDLNFVTKWGSTARDPDGKIQCQQEIQVKGVPDLMHNDFCFFDLTPSAFSIQLENQALGNIIGRGIRDKKLVAWEFRVPELGFEGYEFYELQPDGSYTMRAEYATDDDFRTVISGRIWQGA